MSCSRSLWSIGPLLLVVLCFSITTQTTYASTGQAGTETALPSARSISCGRTQLGTPKILALEMGLALCVLTRSDASVEVVLHQSGPSGSLSERILALSENEAWRFGPTRETSLVGARSSSSGWLVALLLSSSFDDNGIAYGSTRGWVLSVPHNWQDGEATAVLDLGELAIMDRSWSVSTDIWRLRESQAFQSKGQGPARHESLAVSFVSNSGATADGISFTRIPCVSKSKEDSAASPEECPNGLEREPESRQIFLIDDEGKLAFSDKKPQPQSDAVALVVDFGW